MGKDSELLIEMIKRQVADCGIVVWYDPQKDYSAFIERLGLSHVTILKYEDGFFEAGSRGGVKA